MIDTHYHLDQLDEAILEEMLASAKAGGVTAVVAPATGVSSAKRLLSIAKRYPQFVKIGFGMHPEHVAERCLQAATGSPDAAIIQEIEQEWQALKRLVHTHRQEICAIGEIGLPYYALPADGRAPQDIPSVCFELFESQLLLAKQTGLPVILHAVHQMALPCLWKLCEHQIEKAVFHWLKAPPETVAQIVEAGYFISFTPETVYRERNQRIVMQVPLAHMLLETDGPWPYDGPYQGNLTHPLWIREVAAVVARLHGVSTDEVISITSANAARFFQIGEE
ncbi:TatD family hydrolase [Effusibacillus dendaii]|uniref:Uncharacterized protein n=1 Tax=Effusibacillus dendaii TaxID=2743772 RepID=A0A7I8D934_9BACL|nr:TatD family hydrolase [Effusibacillus dendaii]BCJ85872.1 hypothetical protein skT53_08570 [Effusibacillus dendaii]